MKICILLSGQPRNYKIGYENLKVYLNRYDCDVYIHSWDSPIYESTQFDMNKESNKYVYDNVYDDITNLYNPKSFIFEKPIIFDNAGVIDPMWRQPLQATKSMWYSINKVYESVEGQYDLYIRARFDLQYETATLHLESLDTEALHLWDWDTDIRVKHRGYYDVFAVGNSINMEIYSSLYTKLDWYLNYDVEYTKFLQGGWPGQDTKLRNEYLLKWHLLNTNVKTLIHKTDIKKADGQIIR